MKPNFRSSDFWTGNEECVRSE